MYHSKQDDPKLNEVKAVLKRLQRISAKPGVASVQSAEDAARQLHPPQLVGRPVRGRADNPAPGLNITASGNRVNTPKRRLVEASVATAFLVFIVVAIYAFFAFRHGADLTVELRSDSAPASPVAETADSATARSADAGSRDVPTDPSALSPRIRPPGPPGSQAALRAASELLTSGQIQAARAELFRVAHEDSADVAWALARSYDPNFLGSMPTADAVPDIVEATRWYRSWYGIAVKQGLVTDGVSLDRIIRSMR